MTAQSDITAVETVLRQWLHSGHLLNLQAVAKHLSLAFLDSIREPNPATCHAGRSQAAESRCDPAAIWRAMIDAKKAEISRL